MLAHDAVAVFSQYVGIVALVLMGLAQVISTRLRGVEAVFGPLDRAYVLHKWIGIGALAAILFHDTVDAEVAALGPDGLLEEIGETLGELSLYGILVLIVITLVTFVPYHHWRRTHKFMGAFFAAGAVHFMLEAKPFTLGSGLGIYTLFWCVLGVAAYAYTLLPYGLVRGRNRYRVEAVEPEGDSLAVTLAPEGRGIRHRAGQFLFLQITEPALSEVHPFTISAAPADDRRLRCTIRPLGDWSTRLGAELRPGMTARVEGPFGHFGAVPPSARQIWIAAGIGVTPFVALAAEAAGRVDLFYSVRRREDAAHLAELEALSASRPGFTLHLVETSSMPRLSAAAIHAAAGPLEDAQVLYCGPRPLRDALMADLVAQGLPAAAFHYEHFDIRSAYDVVQLAEHAWTRIGPTLRAGARAARRGLASVNSRRTPEG